MNQRSPKGTPILSCYRGESTPLSSRSRRLLDQVIFPRKNGHIAKPFFVPQNPLGLNSQVSNEDAYDYNTHRCIQTHVF